MQGQGQGSGQRQSSTCAPARSHGQGPSSTRRRCHPRSPRSVEGRRRDAGGRGPPARSNKEERHWPPAKDLKLPTSRGSGGSRFEEMPPVEQSVHAGATKLGPGEFKQSLRVTSPTGEQLDSSALEPRAEASVFGPKKDACFALEGKFLGECGSRIAQGLLEVLPFRSQTTGGGETCTVFPLPTSGSVLHAY